MAVKSKPPALRVVVDSRAQSKFIKSCFQPVNRGEAPEREYGRCGPEDPGVLLPTAILYLLAIRPILIVNGVNLIKIGYRMFKIPLFWQDTYVCGGLPEA